MKRSAPEQVGGGSAKRARSDDVRAPVADDPIAKSIDLAWRVQSSDTIYELVSASLYEMKETISTELTAEGNVEFYTTLGVKMGNERFTTESPIPLSSHSRSTSNHTELNNILDRTYDQFADKLEAFEEQGWRVKQLVQLTLHFPHRVQYIAHALDGVLQEYTINLERQEQTAESIFEVLSGAVYLYRNTIVPQLRRKHCLKSSTLYILTFTKAPTLHLLPSRRLC